MQIYQSTTRGSRENTKYPYLKEINKDTPAEELKEIFSKDYVTASYKDNKRCTNGFISSDCLAMDLDNDHSDNPADWITTEQVIKYFEGVFMVIHFSRNHNKEKGSKTARPRFHVLFQIDKCTDASIFKEIKMKVLEEFPYFDDNATDAARFFFGTDPTEVMVSSGTQTLNSFIESLAKFEDFDDGIDVIREGDRNNRLHHLSLKYLKKYGDCETAKNKFLEANNRCSPPLGKAELRSIWQSSLRFYKEKILKDPNYKKPSEYLDFQKYKPDDFTDVGQAKKFSEHYKDLLAYNDSYHFMAYKDGKWHESECLALGLLQEFTDAQLKEAEAGVLDALNNLPPSVIEALADGKSAVNKLKGKAKEANKKLVTAKEYQKFASNRRNSNYMSATLKQVTPMVERPPCDFDKNPFLLATPTGAIDLRIGVSSLRENRPDDLNTMLTSCSPGDKGKELFLKTLDTIFGGDRELIDYVQLVCGIAAIGRVYEETLIIAHGDGGNGKSTFWNTIVKVFGDYGGVISSDNLFAGMKNNIKFETAEMKGKRILIASENQQGARLDDGNIKKLCSTDKIKGEKKFKTEFIFEPSHTLVLYTNHLPKVTALDDGTWRRLKVVPFSHKFAGKEDTKNFSDVLYDESKEYILKWIIEGSVKVYESHFKLVTPKAVNDATNQYREINNWIDAFLNEECNLDDKKAEVGAGELFDAYIAYTDLMHEKPLRNVDFYAALDRKGFEKRSKSNKKFYLGIAIKSTAEKDFKDEADIERQEILTD